MEKEMIHSLIRNVLQLVDPVITDIRRTPGGMTNNSYFVTVNGEKYVVRIPGSGTDELIDRYAEKDNLIYGTELGINPELVYFDVDSGIKITRKIESSKTLTPELARKGQLMKEIITVFQRLHHSKTIMKNRFQLFLLMNHYESLVNKVNPLMMEKVAPIKDDILDLKKVYESFDVKEVPCHIDTVPANFIIDTRDQIYLIDWEYSGMFDPMWDLATLFVSLNFTEEEELFFLTHYLEREPNQEEMQRILLHKVFQDYLWSLWTFYKEAKGDDFGSTAIKRIERAVKNIAEYHTIYNRNNVV